MTKKRKSRVMLDDKTKQQALREIDQLSRSEMREKYGVSVATVARWKAELKSGKLQKVKAKKSGETLGADANSERRDVITFLEMAEKAILRSGAKRISTAESYAMLALSTLRGA